MQHCGPHVARGPHVWNPGINSETIKSHAAQWFEPHEWIAKSKLLKVEGHVAM